MTTELDLLRWRSLVFPDPAKIAVSPLNGQPKRTKVAILGQGAGWSRAPLDDPSWDVWGINAAWRLAMDSQHRFRADCWFDLHEMHAQEKHDLEWFAACPCPLYLVAEDARFPQAQAFPLAEMLAAGCRDYFANSFAYLIALAMSQGYRTIGFFGGSFDGGREVAVERACVSYWLGLAEGRGIEVVIGDGPDWQLLEHPARYGFEYWKEVEGVKRIMAARLHLIVEDAKNGMCGVITT